MFQFKHLMQGSTVHANSLVCTIYVPADSLVRREERREPPSNAKLTG